jgi:hypothetical protein
LIILNFPESINIYFLKITQDIKKIIKINFKLALFCSSIQCGYLIHKFILNEFEIKLQFKEFEIKKNKENYLNMENDFNLVIDHLFKN